MRLSGRARRARINKRIRAQVVQQCDGVQQSMLDTRTGMWGFNLVHPERAPTHVEKCKLGGAPNPS
jgi:hypothetical protein